MSSNGPSLTEGRVEVFYEGVWGAIFDPDWTALDAAVVCKELGHNPKGTSVSVFEKKGCITIMDYQQA